MIDELLLKVFIHCLLLCFRTLADTPTHSLLLLVVFELLDCPDNISIFVNQPLKAAERPIKLSSRLCFYLLRVVLFSTPLLTYPCAALSNGFWIVN